ncbi:MAG: hypothetical protein EHM24_18165 [Acidobacteria bacterium]|nr:MAG: hypothetical protein EHM24_18165 [Acidobacteriota bacterium]
MRRAATNASPLEDRRNQQRTLDSLQGRGTNHRRFARLDAFEREMGARNSEWRIENGELRIENSEGRPRERPKAAPGPLGRSVL